MPNSPDLGTLVGGGDCQDHYHNSDRFPSRDTLMWLHSLERVKRIDANYTVSLEDDIIVVDSSGLTITLPPARNGKHFRFSRQVGNSTIVPHVGETINGSGSHTLGGGSHDTCHLKAIPGGWIEI